jgi:hypothetical protein
MMNHYDELQDNAPSPKPYRALLRARYYDHEGKEAVVEQEAHLYATNEIEAEVLFDSYPKIEPTQEKWHVSSIECLD